MKLIKCPIKLILLSQNFDEHNNILLIISLIVIKMIIINMIIQIIIIWITFNQYSTLIQFHVLLYIDNKTNKSMKMFITI